MTARGTGAAAPFTDAARARLVTAYEACELADLARAAVPVGERELNPDGSARTPGDVLAHAARVLAAAQRYVQSAAVFERVAGADWQLVGDVLDVTPRTARACFAMPEAAFREALRSPEGPRAGGTDAEVGALRDHMAREPLETALDLDDWVRHHADGDSDPGTAPVSGGLVRVHRAG